MSGKIHIFENREDCILAQQTDVCSSHHAQVDGIEAGHRQNTCQKAGNPQFCDQKASVVRPVKELKGFKKVTLAPLEVAVITFEITQEMLRFYDIHMNYVSEPGKFSVFMGSDSTTQQYVEFQLMD